MAKQKVGSGKHVMKAVAVLWLARPPASGKQKTSEKDGCSQGRRYAV